MTDIGKRKTPSVSDAASLHIMNTYIRPLRSKGGRLPTIRALAEELGVNSATVAKVLHRLQAEGHLRSVTGSGTYVLPSKQRKTQMGIYFGGPLLDPCLENRVYSYVDRAFQKQMHSLNFEMRQYIDTHFSDLSPVLLNEASSRLLDALFIVTLKREHRERILGLSVPTIGLNDAFSNGGVFFDYHDFTQQAVSVLKQRGCRRIGLIATYTPEMHRRYFSIFEGFTEALSHAGLIYVPEWIAFPEKEASGNFTEYGNASFRKIWNAKPHSKLDGIVVQTDVCALGARQAAMAENLHIGKDLLFAFAGNQESQWSELNDCLGFNFSIEESVARAITLLRDCVEGGGLSTLFVRASQS